MWTIDTKRDRAWSSLHRRDTYQQSLLQTPDSSPLSLLRSGKGLNVHMSDPMGQNSSRRVYLLQFGDTLLPTRTARSMQYYNRSGSCDYPRGCTTPSSSIESSAISARHNFTFLHMSPNEGPLEESFYYLSGSLTQECKLARTTDASTPDRYPHTGTFHQVQLHFTAGVSPASPIQVPPPRGRRNPRENPRTALGIYEVGEASGYIT